MKCFGFTINLKDDPQAIEQYKAYHRAAWPEVLEHARNSAVPKTKIFLLGRRLFMYIETTDDLGTVCWRCCAIPTNFRS